MSQVPNDGTEAYSDDAELSDNPHPVNSDQWIRWNTDWKKAQSNDPLADMCGGGDDSDEDEDEDDDFEEEDDGDD